MCVRVRVCLRLCVFSFASRISLASGYFIVMRYITLPGQSLNPDCTELLYMPFSAFTGQRVQYLGSKTDRSECRLPADPGPCLAYYTRHYFDTEEESCKMFIYGGCLGNRNNFASFEECQASCQGWTSPLSLNVLSATGHKKRCIVAYLTLLVTLWKGNLILTLGYEKES